MKTLIKYIILGIIQGITEPIPVSSSGHIIIFKAIFNIKLNDINYEIILNFASFLAILLLYKNEIKKYILSFFNYLIKKEEKYTEDYKYVLLIIIGTIPAVIFGFLFKDKIDLLSDNIKIIGLALIITSIFLFIIKDSKGFKQKKDILYKDAIIIGLFQVFSLLPGISRSASTLFGALLCNLDRKTSVNYSFMLYLPISLGSFIFSLSDITNIFSQKSLIIPYAVSFIFALFFTMFSAKKFIDIVKKGKLIYYVLYCLIVGILVFIFL